MFITTSNFTPSAKDISNKGGKRVVLIDGIKLAHLMIEFGVGVSSEVAYDVKKIDLDYFEDIE